MHNTIDFCINAKFWHWSNIFRSCQIQAVPLTNFYFPKDPSFTEISVDQKALTRVIVFFRSLSAIRIDQTVCWPEIVHILLWSIDWLHVGDRHAVGWGVGPLALVTPVKAIRVGMEVKINEKDAGVGSFIKTVVHLFSTTVHNSFDETTHLANTLSLNIVTDQKGKLVGSQESYTTTFSETRILLFLHFCAEM